MKKVQLASRFLAFLAVLSGSFSWAEDPGPSEVVVRTVDGRIAKGRFLDLSPGGTLRISAVNGRVESFESRQVVSIGYGTLKVVRHGFKSRLLRFDLSSGDVLFGNILESTFDDVRITCAALGTVTLPLDRVRMVTVIENSEGIPRRLGAEVSDDRDVVFVRSTEGIDHVVGEVARFAQGGVYFEWTGDGETLFSFRKQGVVAVRFSDPDVPAPSQGVYSVVFCRDGSRISGVPTRKEGGPIQIKLAEGQVVDIKESEVVSIGFRNGDFTFLSDLKSPEVKETPYVEGSITYGLKRDTSLGGGPATISTVHFPKALCVHNRCEVTYRLEGRFSGFSTAIGIDGRVTGLAEKGAVNFTVALDGKTIAGPFLCRAGDDPRWIQGLDITGGKALTLKADFADNLHFNGWAVWGGAMVVGASR